MCSDERLQHSVGVENPYMLRVAIFSVSIIRWGVVGCGYRVASIGFVFHRHGDTGSIHFPF